MIEQIFKLTQGNEKTVEKVIIDENIHYMHMILNKGECLPEHFSNAKNVYITVVRGTLSATLNEEETHEYQAGTVLKVPFHTKMNLKNVSEETLDEAPMAYKPLESIVDNISDTVEVLEIIKPVYNFKAG